MENKLFTMLILYVYDTQTIDNLSLHAIKIYFDGI